MGSGLGLKERTAQPTRVTALKPVAPAKAPREQKLGATVRSFAILEHVAASQGPVDVLDIIASLKLPKATAYRLVDWFIGQGYLARRLPRPSRRSRRTTRCRH